MNRARDLSVSSRAWWASRGLALAWMGFALLSCAPERQGGARSPVRVRVATVESRPTPQTVEAVGSTHGAREATLAGKVMGRVLEIRATAGETVRQGQVLILLDSRDVEGQIAQAEGALEQARASATLAATNLARFELLHQRGSASTLELDQARAQKESAEGAVRQAEGGVAAARSVESYAQIAAPFDGRVVDRLCDVGDLAAPGQPLLQIEDAERMRMHVWLGSEHAEHVAPGAAVPVEILTLGRDPLDGLVAEVVPAADPATHTTLVKIDLAPRPGLRAGLFGRAFFPAATREAVRVSRRALRTRGSLTGIFVAEQGRAGFRLLSLADTGDEEVEVVAGLVGGETIIPEPPGELEIGSPIEVIP
jgi:RND family efflux transporter MFP subunit